MQSMASSTWVFYNRTGLSRHGASQPAGAGGCSRKFPELPVALPQSKPLGVSAPLRRLSQAQPYTKDRVELQGRRHTGETKCGRYLRLSHVRSPAHVHFMGVNWREILCHSSFRCPLCLLLCAESRDFALLCKFSAAIRIFHPFCEPALVFSHVGLPQTFQTESA